MIPDPVVEDGPSSPFPPKPGNESKPMVGSRRARVGLALLSVLALALLSILAPPPVASADDEATTRDLPRPRLFESASARNAPFFRVDGGKGARLHLLGTIHLGPKEGWTFPRRIRRALAKSETLVMEIDLRLADEETVSQAVIEHVMLPDGQRLSKLMGPETRALIEKYDRDLLAAGLPFMAREGLNPWFVATSLTELATSRSGYSMSRSVDDQVIATLGDREFIALETLEEQFGFFDALSMEVQEALLKDTLLRWDRAPELVQELVDAWRLGDTEKLIALSREGLDTAPELEVFFDILLDQRNQDWISRLVPLLESPERAGTEVFVAVGSFHLVGPNSVPELLQDAGYEIKGKGF